MLVYTQTRRNFLVRRRPVGVMYVRSLPSAERIARVCAVELIDAIDVTRIRCALLLLQRVIQHVYAIWVYRDELVMTATSPRFLPARRFA